MKPSRALAIQKFAKSLERIKRKDARIVEATQLAAHIDPVTGEIPESINGRRLTALERRVAMDARNSKRDAPMYIELAAKRYEVERKVEALRSSPTPLNAQAVAFVFSNPAQTARYPVIDVEAKDVTSALPALPEPVTKGDADGGKKE